jgi:hypothetical protein
MSTATEDLVSRFLAAPNSNDRRAVSREIDKRDDAEAVYAQIRERINQQHEEQVRMLDAGQPQRARKFPR